MRMSAEGQGLKKTEIGVEGYFGCFPVSQQFREGREHRCRREFIRHTSAARYKGNANFLQRKKGNANFQKKTSSECKLTPPPKKR